ncbi:hypothetical protein GE061_001138 [Apolygus lucorum]|uniref:Uncharacterized protein n=1 Tax=Apolygus lucorum TaxID=248454 RepID=A0A6A4K4P0_APOLU|nr:hypothetical protein GE061_001138 [Apolygus lucorum]
MDLHSVLLSPKSLASALYYKQKLQVHNFSIYELNQGHVELYVWHEADGGVTSNEFTSCLIDYISNRSTYHTIVLISDGCCYLNRNKVLASNLSTTAKHLNITIQQLYLEKGHTMMEVDSVHATLEKYFRPPINSPADYVARMRLARPTQPYNVRVVDFSFFKRHEDRCSLTSLRPGKKSGDPTVMDIRQLKYTKDGLIFYTLDYSEDWIILPQRRKSSHNDSDVVAPLYSRPRPISKSKYDHLQELKAVIEKDHHAFYDSLTYV